MARLFISLYLFITFALIGLSAGLDRVFFSGVETQTNDFYAQVLEQARQQNVDMLEFAKGLNLTAKTLLIDDIAWPSAARIKLQDGQALLLNDPQVGEQIYIAIGEDTLLEVILPQAKSESTLLFFYSVVFFILLGGVIGLWIWPLWRDLSSLQKAISEVLPDGSIGQNKINKTSLVFPIAQSLNAMAAKISQLMQNQRELSGAVAHEFRTPLARLKFALAVKPDAQSDPWHDMYEDVNELERLVQEMLDYASNDAQIPEINLAEIPIVQLCQQLIQRLKKTQLNNVELQVIGDDINVLADEHFIERAIENLLINATRYAKSTIKIKIVKEHNVIEIRIEDDGVGVAENLREKIFNPFFRPDEGRTRQQGGAGLGLAIVKRIVDWHQGRCFVTKSELGGACFVIQLPDLFS
jgi:two-component system OmpR family sensor kinase